jgi:hypothetical protein
MMRTGEYQPLGWATFDSKLAVERLEEVEEEVDLLV